MASRRPTDVERARRWRVENAEAIEASNAFVKEKGLPLAELRLF
jgi:antitoxin CcdA